MKPQLLFSACVFMLVCGAALASPNQKVQEGAQSYMVSNNANQDLLLLATVMQQQTQLETIGFTAGIVNHSNEEAYYPFQYVINKPAANTKVNLGVFYGSAQTLPAAYFDLAPTTIYCVCPNEGNNKVNVCNRATPLLTANATNEVEQSYYKTLCEGEPIAKKGTFFSSSTKTANNNSQPRLRVET